MLFCEDLGVLEIHSTREFRLGGTSERYVLFKGNEKLGEFPARIVRVIQIWGNINLTWKALNLLEKYNVLLIRVNNIGEITSITHNLGFIDGKALKKLVGITLSETSERLSIAKQLIGSKIMGQANHLERKYRATLNDKLKEAVKAIKTHSNKLNAVETIEEILGVEGMASKYYFKALITVIPVRYKVKSRSTKKHPEDPFNSALNYAYGIIKNLLIREVIQGGLPPIVGFLHSDKRIKIPLIYDLMEPIRPFIDNYVTQLFTHKTINEKHYKSNLGKTTLTLEGRRLILDHISNKINREQYIILNIGNADIKEHKTNLVKAIRLMINSLKLHLKSNKQRLITPIHPR